MKKTTINIIIIFLFLIFNSCSFWKQFGNEEISYTLSTNPLEMHANKISVEIDITFPPKTFHKKSYLVIYPYLAANNSDIIIKLNTITLQGEKVKDNCVIIPYKSGGSYTYKDTLDYQPDFRNSKLKITVYAQKANSLTPVVVNDFEIATGIITTPELITEGLKIDNGEKILRTIETHVSRPASFSEKITLNLYYPFYKSELTVKEQNKQEIETFVNECKAIQDDQYKEIIEYNMIAYTAPNERDSMLMNELEECINNRQQNAQNFIVKKLTKAGVKDVSDVNFLIKIPFFDDMASFTQAIQESEMEQDEKDMILKIISIHRDPERRENELKNFANVYSELINKVYPKLSKVEIQIVYKTKPKTTQELISLGKIKSSKISQTELFYAAQSAENTDKEIIYKNYIKLYPNDWKAYNNLATYYIYENKISEAENHLRKAENIVQNNATILNNYGVLFYSKGNIVKAEKYFNKAKAINDNNDIGYNLGVLQIQQAKYSKAIVSFGVANSFNKALAQLLAGMNEEAKITLDNVKSQGAYYYYLHAIIAARNSEQEKVFENLTKVVLIDKTIEDYAKNDIEFRQYFENAEFQEIVK